MPHRIKRKSGQSVVEYLILFGVIGLATFLSLEFFYGQVQPACQDAVYEVMDKDFMHSPEE